MSEPIPNSSNDLQTAQDVRAAPRMPSAGTKTGDEVCNLQGEKLGRIQDLMIDIPSGSIRCVVLSSGGFLGMGDRLFAVPWASLHQDGKDKRFTLDVDVERVKKAPAFGKDHWPNMADSKWNATIDSYHAG